jgi:hypothetical protein
MYGLDKLNKIITIRKIILSFLINNYNQDLFAKSNLTYQKVIDSSDKLENMFNTKSRAKNSMIIRS